VGIWMVLSGQYAPLVAVVSFLFIDLSCTFFSICSILIFQFGIFSAHTRSWAILFNHSILASLYIFWVVHSSWRSLVTSFLIWVLGWERVVSGSTPSVGAHHWINGVSGLHWYLQSKMCLYNTSCASLCISSGERL
jgi:hypothetical protein